MHSVRKLARIDFNIPGVKVVGMELITLLNAPEPNMVEIARTAELDPAVLGSILACANSPLYGGITEVVDLRVALPRLGLKEIRRIIFHVVLESAFRSDNAEANTVLRELWRLSLTVALIMQRLIPDCPQVRSLPVDRLAMVYPLGLMHSIGIPVLLINFFDIFAKALREGMDPSLPEMFHREKGLFDGFDHCVLGSELVSRWGFPDFFCDVIGAYHQANPDLNAHSRVLHSLLRYARYLAADLVAADDTHQDYWLQGNMLDTSSVDPVSVMADVIDQISNIPLMLK